jgi:hypothetical protein
LNNPNNVANSNKNIATSSTNGGSNAMFATTTPAITTDTEINRNGPYFDVAASKNVSEFH